MITTATKALQIPAEFKGWLSMETLSNYVGDSYIVGFDIAHPDSGEPYRPVLVMFLDPESRHVVAWWLSDAASIVRVPYTPQEKVLVERFIRTVAEHHDKDFASCNALPSQQQYIESLTCWLVRYHDTPQAALHGHTPAYMWADALCKGGSF